MPLRADAIRNRAAILDAAVPLLAERPETTLQDIADAAGVGRTTVYRHFTSRDELLDELLAVAREEMDERIRRDCFGTEIGVAFRRLATILIDVAERYRFFDVEIRAQRDPLPASPALTTLVTSAQAVGAVREDMPVEWITSAIRSLTVAASLRVQTGQGTRAEATGLLSHTLTEAFATSSRQRVRVDSA